MAKVSLQGDWFAPTEHFIPDKLRKFSGRLFKKGTVVEIPDELIPFLPKSAKLLDKAKTVEPKIIETLSLRDLDIDRANMEQEAARAEEADKAFKANLKNRK